MTKLSDKDLKLINDSLDTIDQSLNNGTPAVQPPNTSITAQIAPVGSIINNTAYHDYYRLEIGSPVITTQNLDKTLTPKLTSLVDIIGRVPWMFGPTALNMQPTDADEVEALLAEAKADLANMAAGPVPAVVQRFVIEALADYIDQTLWTALSPGERDRLGQLASAWASLTEPTPASAGSSQPQSNENGGLLQKAEDALDPFHIFH